MKTKIRTPEQQKIAQLNQESIIIKNENNKLIKIALHYKKENERLQNEINKSRKTSKFCKFFNIKTWFNKYK